MLCELVQRQSGLAPANGPERAPLDRRSFLMCALASGVALGEIATPAVASPSSLSSQSGQQAQSDAQFTVEAKFYDKLAEQEDQVQALPARMQRGRQGARLLRRARESRRRLLHAGPFARLRCAHRSNREEAAVPLSARNRRLLDRHRRVQRELQVLPELGDLAVAPRADSRRLRASAAHRSASHGKTTAPLSPTRTASRSSSASFLWIQPMPGTKPAFAASLSPTATSSRTRSSRPTARWTL